MREVLKKAVLFDAPEKIDQKIVELARVSSDNPKNPNYKGLLKYLLREKHFSPFDMCNVTFEIITEKDVAIQILRHPIFPQEWSQRYADCSDMKAELRECRLQDEKNRQNSLVCEDKEISDWWEEAQTQLQDYAFKLYQEALKLNIAKELSRSLLPIGLTSTKMFLNATVRQWLFYCMSRMHKSTQKEHREVAKEVFYLLWTVAPCTVDAFTEFYLNTEDYDLPVFGNV